MADNTELASGSGGDTLRTLEDASSIKWPAGVVAYATTVGTPDVLTIPTAAALADNTATPTTLLQGSCLMVYDGATWDMGRGDATNGLLVNLGSNNDVSLTGNLPDTAAGDLAAMVVDLAAIEALLGTIDADTGAIKTAVELLDNAISGSEMQVDVVSSALPTGAALDATLVRIESDTGAIQLAVESIDNAIDGTEMQVDVVAALPAGNNNIGNVDIASSVALDVSAATVTVDNGGTFAVQSTLQAADNVAGRFKLTDGTEGSGQRKRIEPTGSRGKKRLSNGRCNGQR